MKFIHTADWHLGAPNQPAVYAEQALPELIRLARSAKVKHVLVVGDVFDKPKPDQRIKDYLLSILLQAKDIHWYFMVGNHDYIDKAKSYHSLTYLSLLQNEFEHIHVCKEGINGFEHFAVIVLPDDLKLKRKAKDNPSKYTIGMWHGIFPGINIKNVRKGKTVKSNISKLIKKHELSYLALGDIHKHIQLHSRCCYSGALTQKTYACEDGLFIVELNENKIKVTSTDLCLPERHNMVFDFEEGEDSEETIVNEIKKEVPKGDLLRLKFHLPMKIFASINKKYIKDKLAGYLLELKIENEPVKDVDKRKYLNAVKKAKTVGDEVAVLLKENDYSLERKKLREYCERYFK